MVGIRLAAGRASSEPQRAIERYDFVMKEKFSILPNTGMVKSISDRRSLFAVRFVDYAPMVFRRLRERFHISSETYVRSVGPEQLLGNLLLGNLSSLSELVSEGRSGALFYYTADGKFMIKT
ncbi:phosphatidylinositol-4-phosphate 5-kinase, partial [Toxoplasma gondii TgCatPRC2]